MLIKIQKSKKDEPIPIFPIEATNSLTCFLFIFIFNLNLFGIVYFQFFLNYSF